MNLWGIIPLEARNPPAQTHILTPMYVAERQQCSLECIVSSALGKEAQ